MQYSDTLGLIFNETKTEHIGCLVEYLTSSDSGILDSEHISKHQLKEKKQKLPDGS